MDPAEAFSVCVFHLRTLAKQLRFCRVSSPLAIIKSLNFTQYLAQLFDISKSRLKLKIV